MPGEVLDDSGMKPGDYAYLEGGKVRAGVLGVRNVFKNTVGVIPMGGRYMPVAGDLVIGIVEDIGPSNWLIDIGAPYPAPLHVNEVPWKVEFGDTSRFIGMEDVLMLKILSVDESKKIQVTMKDSGLRKIEGGQLVDIAHTKISRVIGKGGSMIQMIKNMTDCRLLVGQNGRIWVDGDEENVQVAADAIGLIDAQAQSDNLTERVREYIAERLPQSDDGYYDDGGDRGEEE